MVCSVFCYVYVSIKLSTYKHVFNSWWEPNVSPHNDRLTVFTKRLHFYKIQKLNKLKVLLLLSEVKVGWHGGAVANAVASQLKGPVFELWVDHGCLSALSLPVLPMHLWVSYRYSGFLPPSKDIWKCTLGVNVSCLLSLCWLSDGLETQGLMLHVGLALINSYKFRVSRRFSHR